MSRIYFAELAIKAKALQANGQAYEDLFTDIMTRRDSDFRRIQAYGCYGDGKNDGFNPNTGAYYQVHAPLQLSKETTLATSVKKLENDFNGLFENWNDTVPIKSFKYVMNDKLNGCPALVEQKIAELKSKFSDIDFKTFTLTDLIAEFKLLDLESQQAIVGFFPTMESLTTVSIPSIRRTVDHLKTILGELPKSCENFDQEEYDRKIEFNFLSSEISELMKKAETQTYLLEDFFNSNQDKNFKSTVRDNFNFIYKTQRESHLILTERNAPIVFHNILDLSGYDRTLEAQNAALILMSYFFISCDIYEKPDRE